MGPKSRTFVGDLCLEDMGIVVERVHDLPPMARADTTDVPSRDGTVLTDLTYEPRTITLECRVFRDKWREFERVIDELSAHLVTGGNVPLCTRNHPDEWYDAYLLSIEEGERGYGGSGIGQLTLTFVASDPWRRSASKTVTIPSGGETTFAVNGTIPAEVSVLAENAVRNSTTGLWGLRFDDGDKLQVPVASDAQRVIEIDCSKRTALVSGITAIVTLDSDWPNLTAGVHKVSMEEGTGVATLTWVERSV